MGILNHTSDGHYNVLLSICRFLASQKGNRCERSKMELVLRPNAAIPDPKSAHYKEWNHTIKRWTQLGLFHEDGEMIQLAAECRTKPGQVEDFQEELHQFMYPILFDESHNISFAESLDADLPQDTIEATASVLDFTIGLTWWLAQDPILFRPKSGASFLEFEAQQSIQQTKIIQNSTQAPNLPRWSVPLGFAEHWLDGTFLANPWRAIRSQLVHVFGTEKRLPMGDFLERLSGYLPVLDGGVYRSALEQRLSEKQARRWTPPQEQELSPSLSLALRTLWESNVIALQHEADGGGFRLWQEDERKSHIEWLGKEGSNS